MIPVLTIPHMNRPDLLRRCIQSIDYPVGDLVLIQNGRDQDTEIEFVLRLLQEVPVNRFTHIRGPNLGCSASWNFAMIAFPAAPFWMFAGNDVEFHPGTLFKMYSAARDHGDEYAIMFGNLGHSMFIQTRRGTRRVGLYDWNIFPAYCEDCDFMWRVRCAGEKHLDVEGATATHGTPDMPGSCTIHSNQRMRDENHRTHGNNFDYYRRKWGGMPGEEQFETAFNDHFPENSLIFDPDMRARNIWSL